MDEIFDSKWEHIVSIVMLLAMFINGHTQNWRVWPGRIGKIFGLLVKVMALWTADKGVKWKPGDPDRRTARPEDQLPPAVPPIIGMVFLLMSCCAHGPGPSETMAIVSEKAVSSFNVVCLERARKCISAGVKEPTECEPLQSCQNVRDEWATKFKAQMLEMYNAE